MSKTPPEEADYREYFLDIDEFNHPKVYTDADATYTLLVRLILLEPGTYPTRPEMGVGLVSKYRYSNSDDMFQLQDDISDQITRFLPEFTGAEVVTSFDAATKTIHIAITINDITYEMVYSSDTNTLQEVQNM